MKALESIKQLINRGAPVESMGKQRTTADAAKFARRLGFALPDQYWSLLSFADGLTLTDRVWFSFLESVDVLMIHQEEWIDSGRFWPLCDDGCGDYYCIAVDSSVVFFDHEESCRTPVTISAASIDDFVLGLVCKRDTEGLDPT